MITVDNLTKSYGSIKALKGVSFDIVAGGIVGILGPNGAGKTTTLNLIAGVLEANSGAISLKNSPMYPDNNRLKNSIGYLAEDNPLYDHMLVQEMLMFKAEMHGMTKSDFNTRINTLVDVLGIRDIYYRPIDTLSKGLRQRVGLAQALIHNPDILILDEPTEGLDPNQRQEIRSLITSLSNDHTVLMSSHVMQEIEALCDRVIIINEGEVVASGSVGEITQMKEGTTILQVTIEGDVSLFVKGLVNQFTVSQKGNEVTLSIASDRLDDAYKMIADNTDSSKYVTTMQTKGMNLEEAFRKLTRKE